MMLITAQGVIDNGGFEYFFENEFDGNPDMSDFVLVYEAVGASSSASAMKEALIRSRNPEADYDDLNSLFWAQNDTNLDLLREYIAARPASFA